MPYTFSGQVFKDSKLVVFDINSYNVLMKQDLTAGSFTSNKISVQNFSNNVLLVCHTPEGEAQSYGKVQATHDGYTVDYELWRYNTGAGYSLSADYLQFSASTSSSTCMLIRVPKELSSGNNLQVTCQVHNNYHSETSKIGWSNGSYTRYSVPVISTRYFNPQTTLWQVRDVNDYSDRVVSVTLPNSTNDINTIFIGQQITDSRSSNFQIKRVRIINTDGIIIYDQYFGTSYGMGINYDDGYKAVISGVQLTC